MATLTVTYSEEEARALIMEALKARGHGRVAVDFKLAEESGPMDDYRRTIFSGVTVTLHDVADSLRPLREQS